MKSIKLGTYKGTRILLGNEKRQFLDSLIKGLVADGYEEIQLPIIYNQETFAGKVGDNRHIMFNFKDAGDRNVCLAPEYTCVIQKLASETFLHAKDKKLFYVAECFRGEKPQFGRWRQFTQLGVEILNPSVDHMPWMCAVARQMVGHAIIPCEVEWYKLMYKHITLKKEVDRSMEFYTDKGFEVHCDLLGTASQVAGGGKYVRGMGFAIGIDRVMMMREMINDFSVFKQENLTE